MAKYVTEEYLDKKLEDLELKLDKKFVTKVEFAEFRSENTQRQDEMITILKRIDQERVFTTEWIRRIESDVTMLKNHLHLA